MTIPATLVDEIKRLLAMGGLSQRGIARRVGVSRGSVNAIALGKRPDPQMPRCPQDPEDAFVAPAGPPVRCPTCGAMVRMPCLACTLRALRETRRTSPNGNQSHREYGAARPTFRTTPSRPNG